jgi:uncharacterized protein (TIGR03437 family)
VVAGALPPGLTIAAGTGIVDGVASTTGSYGFSVQVTDAANTRVRLDNQRIEVAPMPEVSLVGSAVGNTFRWNSSCAAGASYSLSGNLASIMSINGTTGTVTGTPTAIGTTSGVWSCLNPTNGVRFSQQLTVTVSAMPRVGIRPGTLGVPFSGLPIFIVEQHIPPFTYSIIGGALTPGLRHQGPNTNAISGTPTAAGIFSWVFRRTDSRGDHNTVEFFQAVSQAQGGFEVSPAVLSFEVVQGQTSPATKSMALRGNPLGLRFTARPGASWLRVSSESGSLPGSLEVSVIPEGLQPGAYESDITFAPANGEPPLAPVKLPIRLTVKALPVPVLSFNFPPLNVAVRSDSPSSTLRGTITNNGGGTADLVFALSPAKQGAALDWLRLTASKIKLGPGDSSTVSMTIDPSKMTSTAGASLSIRAANPVAQVVSLNRNDGGGSANSTNLSVNAVYTACPDMDITPRNIAWRVVAGPKGKKQLGTAVLKFQGGNVPNRWGISDGYVNPPGIKLISERAGVDTTVLIFEVDGTQFNNLDVLGNPNDALYLIKGPCKSMMFTASAIVADNPFPRVDSNFYALAPRKPSAKTEPGKITVTHNGPGDFVHYIDLYSAKSSNTPNNTRFVLIDSTLSHYGTESRVREQYLALPPLPIIQYDVVPGPSFYLHEYMSTFVRDDGARDSQWFKVLQYVGSDSLPLPVFPNLLLTPSTPSFFSAAPQNEAPPCADGRALVVPTLNREYVAYAGRAMNLEALVFSGCGELVRTGSMLATFSNGDRAVVLRPRADGVWTGDWTPQVSDDAVSATFSHDLDGRSATDTVVGAVKDSTGNPRLAGRALFHAATLEESSTIAPGTLYRLRGANLAKEAAQDPAGAAELAGVSVVVNDEPARPLSVSPEEVVFLSPPGVAPESTLVLLLRRGQRASALDSIVGAAVSPGVFTENSDGTGQARAFVVNDSGRTAVNGENPAAAGNTIELQATGLGAVDEAGKVKAPLRIRLGSGEKAVEVEIQEGQAMTDRPGVYTVRFVMPDGIPASAATELVLLADGNRSAVVTLATR